MTLFGRIFFRLQEIDSGLQGEAWWQACEKFHKVAQKRIFSFTSMGKKYTLSQANYELEAIKIALKRRENR